jgi:hypothetical protein
MSPAGFVEFTKRQRRKISKAVPLLFHQQFDGRVGGVTISSPACSSGSRMDYGARGSAGVLALRGILLA